MPSGLTDIDRNPGRFNPVPFFVILAVVGVAGGAAILFRGAPAARMEPTPLPAKVVAGKIQRSVDFASPDQFLLVAADKTVCRVSLPEYAITQVGQPVACAWRTW